MDGQIQPADIHEDVRAVCRRLRDAGHRAWVVGGCVRDLLRGHPANDWDLATSARPEEVQACFRRTIPTGIDHGTVTVLYRGTPYEITTLRGEGAYTDGRRPDAVHFVSDIEEDLARRDFTVNAIAYDPLVDHLVDPFGGLSDLEDGVIRAVGVASERFGEDGLRVLRAARFCASLEFALEPSTRDAIPASLDTFAKVSPERVHEEWMKAFKSARPSRAFAVMRDTGILNVSCAPMAALEAAPWSRLLHRLDALPRDPVLRLISLFLDVEASGDWLAWLESWLRDFRTSRETMARARAVLSHRVLPEQTISDVELRTWVSSVGRKAWMDFAQIVDADVQAGGRAASELLTRGAAVVASGMPLSTKELPLKGGDIIRELQMRPGRQIGLILDWLLVRVLEAPELGAKETLVGLLPEAARATTIAH